MLAHAIDDANGMVRLSSKKGRLSTRTPALAAQRATSAGITVSIRMHAIPKETNDAAMCFL